MKTMTRKRSILLAVGGLGIAVAGLISIGQMTADMPRARAAPGEAAPEFRLSDVYGKTFTLSEFKGRIAVVDFISARCPWSLAYDGELRRLWREYSAKGVQFLAINSNRNDTPAEVKAHQIDKDLTFPVLKDHGNAVADLYGARTTPHVYIVNAEGTLVYAGKPCEGGPPGKLGLQENSIAEILDALLAGKAVEPRQTQPWGCTIKRVSIETQPRMPQIPAPPTPPTAPTAPAVPKAPEMPTEPMAR